MSYEDGRDGGNVDPRPKIGFFSLWYYQKRGDHYYLRFTRYAIALAVLFPLLIILLLLVFFFARPPVPRPATPLIQIDTPTQEAPTPRSSLSPTPLPPRTAPTVRRSQSPANPHVVPTPSPQGNTNE